MRQFFQNNAEILSVFYLCPSIEFLHENNSVVDFCNVAKENIKKYFWITKIFNL